MITYSHTEYAKCSITDFQLTKRLSLSRSLPFSWFQVTQFWPLETLDQHNLRQMLEFQILGKKRSKKSFFSKFSGKVAKQLLSLPWEKLTVLIEIIFCQICKIVLDFFQGWWVDQLFLKKQCSYLAGRPSFNIDVTPSFIEESWALKTAAVIKNDYEQWKSNWSEK